MACPKKYLEMGSFYKYYTGEKIAPCITIFIGGNHEASNYLREMYCLIKLYKTFWRLGMS